MICITSNDSGGAEILSSWLKTQNQRYILNLSGPAIKVFKKKISFKKNYTKIETYKKKIDKIITGTSKNSMQEINAIKYAKKNKIFVASVIDHWINYKKRFTRDKQVFLPDEIWVTDKYAYKIAKKKFNLSIKMIKNYYLADLVKKIIISKKKEKNQILYLNTAIKNKSLEKKRIKYFLTKIKNLNKNYTIKIKPHPNDKKKEYSWINKNYKDINVDFKNDLDILLKESKIIVGCNSMAMVVAKHAKKKVYDGLLPSEKKTILPIKIKKINDLV